MEEGEFAVFDSRIHVASETNGNASHPGSRTIQLERSFRNMIRLFKGTGFHLNLWTYVSKLLTAKVPQIYAEPIENVGNTRH